MVDALNDDNGTFATTIDLIDTRCVPFSLKYNNTRMCTGASVMK